MLFVAAFVATTPPQGSFLFVPNDSMLCLAKADPLSCRTLQGIPITRQFDWSCQVYSGPKAPVPTEGQDVVHYKRSESSVCKKKECF